jgi:hypothetical protein
MTFTKIQVSSLVWTPTAAPQPFQAATDFGYTVSDCRRQRKAGSAGRVFAGLPWSEQPGGARFQVNSMERTVVGLLAHEEYHNAKRERESKEW